MSQLMRKRSALKEAFQQGLMGREEVVAELNADRPRQFVFDDVAGPEKLVNGAGELCLFDAIDSWGGFWGISRNDVDGALESLGEVDELTVRINSPGGEVTEGMAIYSALVDFDASVTVIVEGLAASMGSVIAMAGDRIVMNHGAEMMIHEAWGFVQGPAEDMESVAQRLRRMNDQGADLYAARSGHGDREFWLGEMAAETWYHGSEAVEVGLADEAVPFKAKAAGDPEGSVGGWRRDLVTEPKLEQDKMSSTGDDAPDDESETATTAAVGSERQRAQQVVARAQIALAGAGLG